MLLLVTDGCGLHAQQSASLPYQEYVPIDINFDVLYVHLILFSGEQEAGVWENGAYWEDGEVIDAIELTDQTEVKLVRYGIIRYPVNSWLLIALYETWCLFHSRLVMEEDGPTLYFSTPNSRVYREKNLEGMYINEAVSHLM